MTPYIGSGPYCYANSLAMALGTGAPPPAVIEVLTGSPFGFELLGGTLPLFDPYGWDLGLSAATDFLGVRCIRTAGGTAEEAEERLREASARGVVLVGPVDMRLLLHQPGTPTADGGDRSLPRWLAFAAQVKSRARRPEFAEAARTSHPPHSAAGCQRPRPAVPGGAGGSRVPEEDWSMSAVSAGPL